jgi:hypothetical protein
MLVRNQGGTDFRNEFSLHEWLYRKWPRAHGC